LLVPPTSWVSLCGMAAPRKALTRFDDYYAMMSDTVRMGAFRDAIARVVRPGDVVVDLGAGLGILSLLAVRAGAARVYAIEKSDSIELARAVAERNGMADRIVFVEECSKDVSLDEKADVLISETLGSFGLDENTLEFTIDVRRRLLRPGARMVPERIDVWLCPVEAHHSHERVRFWESVDELDYGPAIDELLSRMSLTDVGQDQLLASPQRYGRFDLQHVEESNVHGHNLFQMIRPGTIHGLAGWFDVQLCPGVAMSTSPAHAATHWRQAFFPLREPVSVVTGDVMEVRLAVAGKGPRSDDTAIRYDYRCTQLALQ